MSTSRVFHKTGPDIEKALNSVLFLYGEQCANLFEFMECVTPSSC